MVFFGRIIAAANVCIDEMYGDCRSQINCNVVAKALVKKFVKASPEEDATEVPDNSVYAYATDLLSSCLLWHGFHEGDGNWIITN